MEKNKEENVMTEELMFFWNDIWGVSLILSIPTLIFYRPVGIVLVKVFLASFSIMILNVLASEIISKIKKKRFDGKYPNRYESL